LEAPAFENFQSGFRIIVSANKGNDTLNDRTNAILTYITENKNITQEEIAKKCNVRF